MERLIEGNPHTSTKTERMANGIHALKTLPAEYERGLTYLSKFAAAQAPPTSSIISGAGAEAGGVALSSSKRQMFLGFQNRRKATVTTIDTTALMMSTKLLSTWFDQKNWVREKEKPTTRIAGSTSRVSFQPTIVRTSQNGTITAVKGRMRPIMALRSDSGKPQTAASV